MVLVSILVLLSGCASFGSKDKPDVLARAPLPAELKACFNRQSAVLASGSANSAARTISDLRQREVKHIKCGKRIIRIYEAS